MSIEDPFQLGHDLGSSVTKRSEFINSRITNVLTTFHVSIHHGIIHYVLSVI